MITLLFKKRGVWGDFPNGPVAKTSHSQCRGLRFNPLSGRQILGGSVVKNPTANAEDVDSIPGSGRSLGRGNGNPF